MTVEQEERMIKAQEDTALALKALANAFEGMLNKPAEETSEDELRVASLELTQREIQAQNTIDRQQEEVLELEYRRRERNISEAQLGRTEKNLIIEGLLNSNGEQVVDENLEAIIAEEKILRLRENELRTLKRIQNIKNLENELGINSD